MIRITRSRRWRREGWGQRAKEEKRPTREREVAPREALEFAFFVSRYACMGFDLVKRDVRKGAKMSQVIEEE